MKSNVLPIKIPFQLVTGMTRMHSTLHGFSKIGLVMLFCRLVLVRNSFIFFQNLPIYKLSQNVQEPVRALDESMWILVVSNQSILKKCHFFFCIFRFAETESTAVLAMLVSQYKITIEEEPQFAGETFEERKSRVLSAQQGITLM